MREAAIVPVNLRKHLIPPLGALLACSLVVIAIVHFQFRHVSARARAITEIAHPQKRAVAAMESHALRVVTAALAYAQHHDPQQLTELGDSAAQFRRGAELFRTNGNGDAALGEELTTAFDELQAHANALIDHENKQAEKTAALRKMVAELDRLLASVPLRAGDAVQAAAIAQMRHANDGMRTSVSILLGNEDGSANVLQMQAEGFASVVGAYRKRASQAHERAWATEVEKILTALVATGQELKGDLSARAADWTRLIETRRQLEQRIHDGQKLAEEKALAQSRSVHSTLSWTRWLLIIMACASLACGFATVVVATRSLARPISHLIEVARAITHGRTRHRASPDAAGEFSMLADAFNQMIEARQHAEEKLQLAHDSLELKVQARTVELWRANKALREETEQRAHAEREFQQAQKMDALGKLAGSIAHDFNNLLTVIIGGAECAQNQLQPDHPAISLLKTVQQAGERAAGLTRPLLTFSRNQVLALEPLCLNEAAEEASRMLQRLMGVNIEVRLSLDPELRRVCANANQMQQVLINLAVNARDAMEGMGVLTITTCNAAVDATVARRNGLAAAEHWVEISVSDTGCGMDGTTKARIFEPFFTTKPAGRGTGLGLSTVFGIVKQTGGMLNVESKVGEGTSFRIYLPATNAVKQQQEDEESNNPPQLPKLANGGDETLLLVDDEEEIRELATMTLEGRGYRVLAAGNSEEAILLGEKHAGEIRALITDVVMPGINGAQLASVLTKIIPNLRVLFVSGHSNESISAQTLLETRADYLQKPYLGETLATKVREILSSTEPRLSDPPGKERFTAWMN